MTNREMDEMLFDAYSGILANNQTFGPGSGGHITYRFDCPEYEELKNTYALEQTAGSGSDFERAKRLLHYLAPRLTHCSWYDNHIECNALRLLEYSLDRPDQGINCLNKSKILQECCMALGIYARRVCIMPYSPFDFDNHVVTEIYDRDMGKWIMLDPTTDGYFVDANRTPLSLLEIRKKFANDEFATYAPSASRLRDLNKLRQKYHSANRYICKNLFYFTIERESCFGPGDNSFVFLPRDFSFREWNIANAQYGLNHLPEEHADMKDRYLRRRKRWEESEEWEGTDICVMQGSPID